MSSLRSVAPRPPRPSTCIALFGLALLACEDGERPIDMSSPDAGELVLRATIAPVGPDPFAGTGVESCPTYQEERCVGAVRQRCEIVDVATRAPVAAPDPLLRRVYLYDRWHDLHSSPAGLTMERAFVDPVAPDAPESDWSRVERFNTWAGEEDAAIWTGAALMSDTFRYAQTHTEADYLRMEARVRTLVRNFEVTGIPGYLARYHFLLVPEGTPKRDDLDLHFGAPTTLRDVDIDLPSLTVDGLPVEYTDGVDDGQGGKVKGSAHWRGDPSIDQYTGVLGTFPVVWSLLRDEALKQRMALHLTCYLKRLRRIEVINLQSRPTLVPELLAALGSEGVRLDPTDPDITKIDRLVWYVLPGINRTNAASFDGTCPAQIMIQPAEIVDAKSDTFELDLVALAGRADRKQRKNPDQVDHFYLPSARGADASHLLQLAAAAYYFTGEEQYRSFLFDELIGKLHADEIAQTMMAFRQPDWCFKFYGDHISYGTHWQLIHLLPEGTLRDQMVRVMEDEPWQKALTSHKNAKFNVLYASTVPDGVSSDRTRAIAEAVSQLETFGGNGGTLEAPRRTYTHTRQSRIDALPQDISVRCPSAAERKACEDPVVLFGIPLESRTISHVCDGRAGECTMDDGQCIDGLASEGLPSGLRAYADFAWQRSPFDLGESTAFEGQRQSPGRDLSEPYWMARHYGYITRGAGQALAWSAAGSCP